MTDIFNLLSLSLGDAIPAEPDPLEEMEEFIDSVMLAADMAAESRGFFMLTVSVEPVDGKLSYVPRIFCTCASDEIADIIQSEILNIAAVAHEESSLEKLKAILKKRGKSQ